MTPSRIPYIVLGALTALLIGYYLITPFPEPAGDIVEYFGVTESLLNHGSLELSPIDRENLSERLNPGYFENPGYYLPGTDGERYPVHFVAYSFLLLPVRVLLQAFGADPLKAFPVLNVLILTGTVAFLMRTVVTENFRRYLLIAAFGLSPALSFLLWPGPDVWYVALLLAGVFLLFAGRDVPAALAITLASWHSQPLGAMAAAAIAWMVLKRTRVWRESLRPVPGIAIGPHGLEDPIHAGHTVANPGELWRFSTSGRHAVYSFGLGVLLFLPYIYNLALFGVASPWQILPDGFTKLYGFGIHNASLFKLYEMYFDLNMGLFWYAPLLFLLGVGLVVNRVADRSVPVPSRLMLAVVTGLFVLTGFFYQTNPGWHYGTSGYGPSRHIIYFIPLLVYGIVSFLPRRGWAFVTMSLLVLTQIGVLSLNGFLRPHFPNTLAHSPFARFVLDRWPDAYSPTPEIFVDRTTGTDNTYYTTAIYKNDDVCVKAYILVTDAKMVEDECGTLDAELAEKLENPYLRRTNYERAVVTSEAAFFPDPQSCIEGYSGPFTCITSELRAAEAFGLPNGERLEEIATGTWKLTNGVPVRVTIPPGYALDHFTYEGQYVTF
jgi:hypothetical protein